MTVDVAVIGAGHWGPHLARNFLENPDSETKWIVDVDVSRHSALTQRFPTVTVTDDLGVALNDESVTAVAVATPTSTHHDVVRKALEAGKHVLVEKPLTNTVESAVDLAELADDRGLRLMVGHVFLFNSAVIETKRRIQSGHLGEVRYISMARTNLGPVRGDVNAAWDLASHDVSIANFLLDGLPVRVSAYGGAWLSEREDAVFATLHYPGDMLVHMEVSWLNPLKRRFISVVGDQRMLTIDDMNMSEPLRIYDKGVESDPQITDTFAGFRALIREGDVTIPRITSGEPLRTECASFVSRVLGGEDRVSDGWCGVDVIRVLEAIDRSLANSGAPAAVSS